MGMDKGIVGSFIDEAGGILSIENVTINGADWGIELYHASATIRNSSFNDIGKVGISFQNSEPLIERNEFNNTLSAISSLVSTGNISMNDIQGSDITGIYLDRSNVTISNNTIHRSSEGIRIYQDRGSTIIENSIHSNDMGLFIRTQDEDEHPIVSLNMIFGNDWGISCLGNSSELKFHENTFEVGDVNNTYGVFREEREVIFHLLNTSSKVYVNISAKSEIVYQSLVSEFSHYTLVNLTTLIRTNNGEDVIFDTFKADFNSGDSHRSEEFNIQVKTELSIELSGTP